MKLAIEIDLPSDIDESVFEEAVAKPARQEIILRLFAERRLRAGQATRLLGVGRLEFMELLKQRDIPYVHYTFEDWQADLKNLEDYERQNRPPENGG